MLPKLDRIVQQLEERRERLLADLARKPPEVLHTRAPSGGWTVLQVAQHLELVERRTVEMLRRPRTRPLRRRASNYLGYVALRVVLAAGVRVSVPGKVAQLIAPPEDSPEELMTLADRWRGTGRELREQFGSYTQADMRRLVGLHAIGGPLTPLQMLLFLRRHFDHHLRQIRRIEAASGPYRAARSEAVLQPHAPRRE